MAEILVLDSGPVGDLVGHPGSPRVVAAMARIESILWRADIVVPEIADYEVRRELIRRGSVGGLHRLDSLKSRFYFDPITTAAMRQAAEFWAILRQAGRPTADPHALDADVILAAQAVLLGGSNDVVEVVTTNANHLSRLIKSRDWLSLA